MKEGGGGLREGASKKTLESGPEWECSQACGLHSQAAWIGIDPAISQLCKLGQIPSLPCASVWSSENRDISHTYNIALFWGLNGINHLSHIVSPHKGKKLQFCSDREAEGL